MCSWICYYREYEFITFKLLGGALDALKRHDVEENNIEVACVPGAFETLLISSKMAKSKRHEIKILTV